MPLDQKLFIRHPTNAAHVLLVGSRHEFLKVRTIQGSLELFPLSPSFWAAMSRALPSGSPGGKFSTMFRSVLVPCRLFARSPSISLSRVNSRAICSFVLVRWSLASTPPREPRFIAFLTLLSPGLCVSTSRKISAQNALFRGGVSRQGNKTSCGFTGEKRRALEHQKNGLEFGVN